MSKKTEEIDVVGATEIKTNLERDAKYKAIIEDDDGSNWGIEESHDINELIDMLDGGFGILNLS